MTEHHDMDPGLPTQPDPAGFYTPIGPRRRFFQWVIAAVSAIIGVSLAIPLIGYVVSPASRRREEPWVDVGDPEQLISEQPVQLEHVMSVRDGYMEIKAVKSVWAVKEANGRIVVFSPICPHLGCGYRWDDHDRRFKCPCHGSVYSVTGQVLAGPAPRPLDPLPSKIENGRLLVMYKEFKAGLPRPVVIS